MITQSGVRLRVLQAALWSSLALLSAVPSSCSKVGMQPAPSQGKNPWTIPGVVRLAVSEEPNTLVRMFSNQSSADDVTALLFEPFFRFDEHERPVPALATAFPTLKNGLISRDGLRVTFNLRPQASWSDGVPVTAADVVFTWHAIVDGKNPVVYTEGYDKIKTIVAAGPHQVVFVLKQPFSPVVYLFSEGTFMPLPAHLLSKYSTLHNIPYDAAPIGDGPFVLKEWLHGSDLIFVPNERYWRGRPHVREIDMKIIPNTNSQLNELRTHEIDVIDGVSKPLVGQVSGVSGVRVQANLQGGYRHLDFNTHSPLLRDARVRRAIAYAIDVPKIIATIYAGYGQRGATDIPPFSWAANDLPPTAYDPARSVRILESAGWTPGPDGIRQKNGERLSLTISTATDNLPNANAEALVSQELKAVGVDLTIKNYAGTVLFAPDGPLYTGRYDLSWIVDYVGVDPDNLAKWGCHWFPPHGSNTDFYCNPDVDRLLTEAQMTFDVNRRRQDYAAAWRLMLHDVPAMIIYWDKNVTATNTDLRNFKPSAVFTDYWNAWEWEI